MAFERVGYGTVKEPGWSFMDNATRTTQNVIQMSEYQPETGFTAISQVEAYWEDLRHGRLMPRRSEIDPRGLELALENAFILERVAPGVARLRVAGGHLSDIMGMEVRGMPLTTFFVPSHRRTVADALEEMFQTPAICTLRLSAPAAPARPHLDARLVLLPLKSDLGDVSRALGCLVAKGEIGSAPRRMDVVGQQFEPLVHGVDSDEVPSMPLHHEPPAQRPAMAGFADATAPFKQKGDDDRPPYLRLIKSNED